MKLHCLSLLGAVVVVVGASGCGGGGSGTEPAPTTSGSPGGVKTVTIDESEFKLAPSSVTFSKPGTYEFKAVNKGTISHALEVEGNGVEEKTSEIAPGSSTTLKVTFTKAGSYEMYCPVDGHKNQGMKGDVTIGSTGAGGTSTQQMTTTSGSDTGGGGY